jgi:hypothetical protein
LLLRGVFVAQAFDLGWREFSRATFKIRAIGPGDIRRGGGGWIHGEMIINKLTRSVPVTLAVAAKDSSNDSDSLFEFAWELYCKK